MLPAVSFVDVAELVSASKGTFRGLATEADPIPDARRWIAASPPRYAACTASIGLILDGMDEFVQIR